MLRMGIDALAPQPGTRGLLKFSEFYCLSHVYEMSDANDDSE
jgi:hypothetical protein